jgi:serine/threonine protein phosphatase 1
MIAGLSKWLGAKKQPARISMLPAGDRIYAVGDIHGRLDLFRAMIEAIEADDAARRPMKTTVILLGDLIDRGPESAGVLQQALDWSRQRDVRVLMGNHEEMLLESLEKVEALRAFINFGGRETVLSFGVDEQVYSDAGWEELQAIITAAIPPETLDFMRGFESLIIKGDYAFVHAGIKPRVPLEEQSPQYLRWIREPFLSSTDNHGHVIVHGHTITDEPVLRDNRIGIDTGAYASGRLTALVLEGAGRWWLTAQDDQTASITTNLQEAS